MNLDKLWDLPNYEFIFQRIIIFFSREQNFWLNSPSELGSIFSKNNKKQIEFLSNFLLKTTNLEVHLKIYNIVISIFNDLKLEFLKSILDKRIEIAFFKRLDFYVLSNTYSGSRIPRIRHAINEYQIVLEFLKTLNQIDFLEHINFIEQTIFHKKLEIERERKREFISHMGW